MSSQDEAKKPGNGGGLPSRKKNRILALLKNGVTLNRFEAQRHGDTCLNSTIADLRADGQPILDEWESVPNRMGSLSRVKRYRHGRPA